MFDAQGNVRGPYKGIFAELAPSDASELAARSEALGRAFVDQGITFSLSGQERPFPLDLVPRVISAAEWSRLERGIKQRVKALEMFLDDIYGEQEILRDGVIPRRLITSCEHFHREAAGIVPPNGVRIHVAGIDLVRDGAGHVPGARGQPAVAVGRLLRDGEPPHDGAGLPEPVRHAPGARGRRLRVAPAARAAQRGGLQRGRSDGRRADARASTTRRTSSIRCWPARWASNSSRAATCSAATTPSTCGPPRASVRSTSSTAASTTSTSTRCTSSPTRCSAWPACSTPRGPATW